INVHHKEILNQELDYYFGTKSECNLDLRLRSIYNSGNKFHLWIRITAVGITTIYLFFPLGFKLCSVGARCHVPGVNGSEHGTNRLKHGTKSFCACGPFLEVAV